MFDYHRQHGLEIRVMRIFNTYGPRMSATDGRVVSNFILQALRGDEISIYGKGEQTRSFCYVDDLLNGMISLMNHETFTGPVNIGNPHEFTILELAENIIRLTNSKSKLTFHPLPQDDPQRRKPNIEMAKATLNWEPKIPLSQGLQATIAYFTSQPSS